MIKKLLTFFVISLWIINFWFCDWEFFNANESFTVPNVSTFALRVTSSSAWIIDGGGMSQPKPLIMLQSNVSSSRQYRYIYFWGTDNKLYAYWNSDWTPTNSSDYEYLKFNTFYRFSNTWFVNCNYWNLHNSCGSEWVSSESFYLDTSLKWAMTRFAYYFDNWNSNNYTAFCWVYDNLGFSICVKPSGASTTSLSPVAWLSIDPVEFSDSLIGFSPWIDNTAGGGWNDNTNNDYDAWIVQNKFENVTYWQCTNWQWLQYYRNTWWFNDVMCYGGVADWSIEKSIVNPWRWFTVFDIYNRQNVEVEGGTLFNNFCDWYNTMEYYYTHDPSIFSGTAFIYKTYWDILYTNDLAWGCQDVYNYCSLLLRSNLDASLKDNPYIPEGDKNNLCNKVVDTSIWSAPVTNSNWSGINWSVVWSNWHGVGAFSWNLSGVNRVIDWKKFINQFFNYAKSWVVTNFSWSITWIIPWYIIVVLLWLVFFRFLSH